MAITWTKQNLGVYEEGDVINASITNPVTSEDGQTICITSNAFSVEFLSYDGGATWQTMPTTPAGGYIYYACPSNGGNIYCLNYNNASTARYTYWIYNRNTFTYTQTFPVDTTGKYFLPGLFNCSSDGRYVITYYDTKAAYVSSDYGATWSEVCAHDNGGTPTNIYQVKCSRDGRTMSVFTRSVNVSSVLHTYLQVSQDYGTTFSLVFDKTAADLATSNTAFGSDDHGQNIMVLGNIGTYPHYVWGGWVTHDYGSSWTKITLSGDQGTLFPYSEVVISDDGSCLIADCSYYTPAYQFPFWVSTDYLTTRTEYFPDDTGLRYDIRPIGCFIGSSSTDILTTYNHSGPLYKSTDRGVTWTTLYPWIGSEFKDYWRVASDTTGTIFLAAGEGAAKYAYVSHNSGSTWEASPVVSGSSQNFTNYSIAMMSDDGMYMYLQDYYGYKTYRSVDSGSTWSEANIPQVNGYIANASMSGNGKYVVFALNYSQTYLYISSNYGASWITDSIDHEVSDIAINYMGSLMITVNSGTVKISRDYGLSWTDITNIIGEQTSYIPQASTLVTCDNSGQNIYLYSPFGYCFASHDSGYTWIVTTNIVTPPPLDYGYDIACNFTGNKVFWISESSNTLGLSKNFGSTWAKDNYQAVQIWYTIGVNGAGTQILAGEEDGYVYLSSGEIFVGGGNIKSIGGVLFENIKKVSGVPIANLKKISGELN